jgi:Domain of unknown function (DUF4258)
MNISQHARARMAERGITLAQVLDAVANGVAVAHRDDPTCTVYSRGTLRVIVNHVTNNLVTTFRVR